MSATPQTLRKGMGFNQVIHSYLFLFGLLTLKVLPSTLAHSFMVVPRADFSHFNKPECRLGGPSHSPNDTCTGPCIPRNTWQHSPNPRRTLLKRGQIISVVWTKNNHHGGFVRLSLVPEALRMNHQAHSRMAFRYACFDSDPHRCKFDTSFQRTCGTQHLLLRTKVQIPYSYPDGDYVLGWAWFGGLNWYGLHSYFGDYWSCADVRIRGGPLRKSYVPVFHPGENVSASGPKAPGCWAGVNMLGICYREPCVSHVGGYFKPYPFNESRAPLPILARDSPYSNPFHIPDMNLNLSLAHDEREAHVTVLKMIDLRSGTVLETEFYKTVLIEKETMLTFKAFVRGPALYLDFFLDDVFIRRERHTPYLMFGDHEGNISFWKNPVFEEWVKLTIVVTARNGSTTSKIYWLRLTTAT